MKPETKKVIDDIRAWAKAHGHYPMGPMLDNYTTYLKGKDGGKPRK